MAITYEEVIQQVLNELGAVKGATAAAADTNFMASPTTSTVIGPDFVPSMIEAALAGTIGEIVEAIASTPHHPERLRFADVTASLANFAAIPQTGSTTARIIGVPSFVRDASDSRALLPATLDEIRSFTRHTAIYSPFDIYRYAINGDRIEHTRTNVVMGVCVFTRPAIFTGNIGLEDWHESGLVWGTVAKLALKESLFGDLYGAAVKCWNDHLVEIRSYGNPDLYGKATAAPASS